MTVSRTTQPTARRVLAAVLASGLLLGATPVADADPTPETKKEKKEKIFDGDARKV